MKEFWKSIKIWQSYRHEFGGLVFLEHSVYSVPAQQMAKHRAKFGWLQLCDVAAVTMSRSEPRWNLLGCRMHRYLTLPWNLLTVYVLENYMAVDSKFPPIFWYKPPDLLFPFPYTNYDAESYHSHLNAELYVKHPNIYLFVNLMYWKSFSRQRLFPWIACHNRRGSLETENRTVTVLSLSLSLSLSHAFSYTFSCVFIHFCRAFLYITKMRFHHQLIRFHKTAGAANPPTGLGR